MKGKKLEIKSGDKYCRLTTIKEIEPHVSPSGQKQRKFLCECSCENKTQVEVQLNNLRRGFTTSCGCWKKEKVTTHGLVDHPLYSVWKSMKKRCYNPNNKHYKNYGGRGITVCDEWKEDFKSFYEFAMANGWERGLDTDRIDNDGNYSPDNCRFVTSSVNNANQRVRGAIKHRGVCFHKRNNKYAAQIKIEGKTKHIGYFDIPELAAIAYDEYIITNNIPNKQLNIFKD